MTAVVKDRALLRSGAYVDGGWVTTGGSRVLVVDNPATGEPLAEVAALSRPQVAEAIDAAARALPAWRALSGKDRARVLRRWFDLTVENAEDLARLIVLEEGKPLAEARGEVAYAASFIEWFAEEAEQTPLTALALAELADRAGVPPGVFNVVTGHPQEIGPELTGNSLVRKISFTGSTEVGRLLLAESAATVKKASMELGGNAPVLVFDDADLDVAVAGVLATKYRNTGQACISANRVYVQDGIHDRFAAELARQVSTLVVGDGFSPGVQQGPLIDEGAVAKVELHIADAVDRGARILYGGARHERGGLFFQPTVLTGVAPGSLIAREETFGPVTPLIRFTDEAEAVALANDTEFGLAAYLFTRDAERTWRVAATLEAGMVGINTGLVSNEVAPFGGIKQSGLGREGSVHGIEEYLEMKYLAWEGSGTATPSANP